MHTDRTDKTTTDPIRITFNDLQADLAQARAENADLRAALRAAEHRATHDPLTGLLNRDGLAQAWTWQVDSSDALALIDLNRFKHINDTYGHDTGDRVLVHIAQHLAARYHVVARLGGDELVVIDSTHRLVDLAASWLVPLADGTELPVTGSVGLAGAAPSLRLTLARADAAMYDAKRDGRDGHRDRWFNRRRHPHLRTVEQVEARPRVRLRDTRVGAA
ncbi:GGDEF domain-containing protein [Micromonospora cathayae]|uniref:GGDEF domain-containing protein n=1 Tax=Micromonospora cathayae TaxID=3028804 RepID=A0ABY7ZZA7_9ACTN|nr:GGDEF domain-containing protein [Micromonospora sp. HUAS 3]WDZ87224.1 GGDEF domain-containing protein [Micromonospora sp. HUAS 3]